MAKVELKQPVVEEISNLLKDAKSAVLVDYRGLIKYAREKGVQPAMLSEEEKKKFIIDAEK